MAWFAFSYWWFSCIWHPRQLWGALVKGSKTPRNSTLVSASWWWCTTQDWKNTSNHWDGRYSLPKSQWSRGMACTGILIGVRFFNSSSFPNVVYFFLSVKFSASEGFSFNWFQFCGRISKGPKRRYGNGEEDLIKIMHLILFRMKFDGLMCLQYSCDRILCVGRIY